MKPVSYDNRNAVMQTNKGGSKNLRSKNNVVLTVRPADKNVKSKNSKDATPKNVTDSYVNKRVIANVKAAGNDENLIDKDEMLNDKDATKKRLVNAQSAMIAEDASAKPEMMPARKSGRLIGNAARMSSRKKTQRNGPGASGAIMEMPPRPREETLE